MTVPLLLDVEVSLPMSNSEASLPRVAVITGASSGIGQATAIRLARDFDHLLLHAASNLQGLHQLAKRLEEKGTQIRMVLQDFSDPQVDEEIVRTAFGWRGRVDAWVQAAGADVLTTNWKSKTFTKKLDRLWQVDVRSSLCLAKSVAEKMSNQTSSEHGLPSIALIGWDQAWNGMEGDSGIYFAATKGAIMSSTASLAKTFGPKVRINCAAPGWIQTAWGISASASWQSRAVGESCLARWGTAEDVASAIAFLCSAEASFINGQILNINGGWQPYFTK